MLILEFLEQQEWLKLQDQIDLGADIISPIKKELSDYLLSDVYKQRLAKETWLSFDNVAIDVIIKARLFRLENTKIEFVYSLYSKQEDGVFTKDDPLLSQWIVMDQKWKEVTKIQKTKSDTPSEAELWVLYIVDLFQYPKLKIENGDGLSHGELSKDHKILIMKNVLIHELGGHAITDGNSGLTEWAKAKLQIEWKKYGEWSEYFANQTEQQSYFMTIRWLLYLTGIIPSLKSDVTEWHIDQLLLKKDSDKSFMDKYYPLIGELNTLFMLYEDNQDSFFKLINEIAYSQELENLKTHITGMV